ncbi:hypothetical protein TIFTF001_029231 [Ficus carica]|uniref:Uncharacterized protein n=1 Tax=Ficus carica TaxID=3494 RepID=A0AA88DRE5_FICCA|nr:hypothetical protein TIFTF001_029231 [Ficus carica]
MMEKQGMGLVNTPFVAYVRFDVRQVRKKCHFIHMECTDWVFRNDGFSFFKIRTVVTYITLHIPPIYSFISTLGALEKSETKSFPKTFESQARFLLFFSILILGLLFFVFIPSFIGFRLNKDCRSEVLPSFVQNLVCEPMGKDKEIIEDVDVEWTSTDSSDSSSDDEKLASTIRCSRFEHEFHQNQRGAETSNEATERNRMATTSEAKVLSIPLIA